MDPHPNPGRMDAELEAAEQRFYDEDTARYSEAAAEKGVVQLGGLNEGYNAHGGGAMACGQVCSMCGQVCNMCGQVCNMCGQGCSTCAGGSGACGGGQTLTVVLVDER